MSDTYRADFAPVAALLADRARAAMLTALMDGRPLAAGELARVAGVSAQTASSHLGRLLDGGLVAVVRQGRHRYYRLAGPEIAEAVESLMRVSPPVPVRSLRQSGEARRLRAARTCYDHLAGAAGVALCAALLDRGLIEEDGDRYAVTAKGEQVLGDLGVPVADLRKGRRRFAAPCLDWTERAPHLSGALGAALTGRMIELGWFERGGGKRGLIITEAGLRGLADAFGCIPAPAA
ncbi:metalloregulator ArsR/SmtB family transcription factor [Spirillospora sp. NPDC127200]